MSSSKIPLRYKATHPMRIKPKKKNGHRGPNKGFKVVPDRQRVQLETGYEVTSVIGTSFSETVIDLTYPSLTNSPKFLAAYFTMYRNAFMYGQDINIEIVNIGSNPVAAVMAESNSTDSASSSFEAVAQTKGAIYRVIGIAGDGSRTVMRHKYSTGGSLGIKNEQDSKSWFTAISQPTYSPRPQVIYGFKCFGTIVGPTTTILVRVKIKYRIEFFTLANDASNLTHHLETSEDFEEYNESEITEKKDISCSGNLVVPIHDTVYSKKSPLVPLKLSKKK